MRTSNRQHLVGLCLCSAWLLGSCGGNGTSIGNGTLFRITAAGAATILYSFAGGTDGSNPSALILGVDGIFYGTTVNGGASNLGTVYTF